MTVHRWCASSEKKNHIVGSLFLACCGVLMLKKYVAGFAEVVFKNILPASSSWSSIFVRFSIFFNRKTLNNFFGKLGFSDVYLQRAVFQQRMHVQSSSQAHLKGNFMYFCRMVLTPYQQHGPLLQRCTHVSISPMSGTMFRLTFQNIFF